MTTTGDILLFVINPISIIACMIVISAFIMFKKLRKYPSFLFFNIFIADFCASWIKFLRPLYGEKTKNPVTYNLFSQENRASCLASGFFLEVFAVAECFMDLAISINLFLTIYWYAHRKTTNLPRKIKNYMYLSHLSWAIGIFFGIVALSKNAVGNSVLWCWLNISSYQVFLLHLEVWSILLINIIIVAICSKTIYFYIRFNPKKKWKIVKLLLFIFIFALTWMPTSTFRAYAWANPKRPPTQQFADFASFMFSTKGLLHSLVYGLNKEFLNCWKRFFKKYIPCCSCLDVDESDGTSMSKLSSNKTRAVNGQINKTRDEDDIEMEEVNK